MPPLVYAGIDEAGYGPMFGPLVVACTTFEVSDHDPARGAPNLWRALSQAVCRGRSDRRRRIAIDDSKKLKGPRDGPTHPLRHLERGVLAFLCVDESLPAPATDSALYQALCGSFPKQSWYESECEIPAAQDLGELRISTSRLRRAMLQTGLRCSMMRAEMIDAGPFNQQLQTMGSKAAVNLRAVMRHVDAIWRRWPHDHPHVVVDRQSGRTHYLRPLQLAYPDAELTILDEADLISRYHLLIGDQEMTISFVTEAERRHLPVALASMTAKYVRELLMARMNRFFQQHMPELKPTAGYVKDGRRFLADIESVITGLGLDTRLLVRQA